MNCRTVITLMLGLVFQLAQLSMGGVATSSCQIQSVSCDCCSCGSSCECAENGDSEQTPSPTPFSADKPVKIPAMKTTETKVSTDRLREIKPSATVADAPRAGPGSGYTGVSLAVAFCSFII